MPLLPTGTLLGGLPAALLSHCQVRSLVCPSKFTSHPLHYTRAAERNTGPVSCPLSRSIAGPSPWHPTHSDLPSGQGPGLRYAFVDTGSDSGWPGAPLYSGLRHIRIVLQRKRQSLTRCRTQVRGLSAELLVAVEMVPEARPALALAAAATARSLLAARGAAGAAAAVGGEEVCRELRKAAGAAAARAALEVYI